MEITPNVGLTLPTDNEYYNINVVNENNTKIDTAIGKHRTYTLTHTKSGAVHTLKGLPTTNGIFQCQFKATANYAEGDTFTGYTAKPSGEDATLPDKAFITGDLVSVVVDTESKQLGFKLGGGGNAGLNIFAQPTPPSGFEGIWLETEDKFKNVQCATDVVEAGDWFKGSVYENMPFGMQDFGCIEYEGKVYCMLGLNIVNDGQYTRYVYSSKVQIYNTMTNSWSVGAEAPSARGEIQCALVGNKIYCVGGGRNVSTHEEYVYNISSNTWSTIPETPDAPNGLSKLGCVADGAYVHVLRGNNTGVETTNHHFVLNTYSNTWSSKSPMPTPRYGFGCVLKDKKIYCIGGRQSSNYGANKNEVYDIATDTWKVLAMQDRVGVGTRCVCHEDKIYCLGLDQDWGMFAYDIDADSWEYLGRMFVCSTYFGCVLINSKIWCFGGSVRYYYYWEYKGIRVFDIQNKRWEPNNDLIRERKSHGCVAVGDKIFVIGGYSSGNPKVIGDFASYNIKTGFWETISSKLPTPRFSFGCVTDGEKIYCLGGVDGTPAKAATFEIYNLEKRSWETLPPMPRAKNAFGCILVNGKIYCIGGHDYTIVGKSLDVYDIQSGMWSEGEAMSTGYASFDCVEYDGEICCFGGAYVSGPPSPYFLNYVVSENRWHYVSGTEVPYGQIANCRCVRVGAKVYVVGGYENPIREKFVYSWDFDKKVWSREKDMLRQVREHGCIYHDSKIYCLGGVDASGVLSKTQIMNMKATEFSEDTLVLQIPSPTTLTDERYSTQLISSKTLLGGRLLTSFKDAWIYKNNDLQQYPAYVGDGKQWNKFKN